MALWNLEFFPSEGERSSPTDTLKRLCNPTEQAEFVQKFKTLGELEHKNWTFKWLKPVKGFYQVTQGNFRAYFHINNKKIVILHFCRKVTQKARDEDINISEANWRRYERG